MIESIKRISGVNPRKCMKCGKCSASCPAYDEMEYHPHQFVDMVENGRIDELMASRGIYMCLSCFACKNILFDAVLYIVNQDIVHINLCD